MKTTEEILDLLRSAEINFETMSKSPVNKHPIFIIAMEQLKEAIQKLEAE